MPQGVCRVVAGEGRDPGGPLRGAVSRGDHQPLGVPDPPIVETQLQRALAVPRKADVLHAGGLHPVLQLKLGDHLAAEGSKEIGVGEAIRPFQLAVALLSVGKAPQGMGVRMGVMGRGRAQPGNFVALHLALPAAQPASAGVHDPQSAQQPRAFLQQQTTEGESLRPGPDNHQIRHGRPPTRSASC